MEVLFMTLIAHWPLDGNLNDISGNGNDLTNVSGTSTVVDGKIGSGYNKTSGYYSTGLTDMPNEMTVSLWMKHNGASWDSECLFGTRTGSNGFMLYRNSGDTDGYYRTYFWYNSTSAAIKIYNSYPGISGVIADTW